MLQLCGEHAAGEAGDQRRGDEHADDVGAHRDAVERGGLFVGADGVDVAADRQPLADDPQHDREREHVERRDRDAEDRASC